MSGIFVIASLGGSGTQSVQAYLDGLGGRVSCGHSDDVRVFPALPAALASAPLPERLLALAERTGKVCGTVNTVYGAEHRDRVAALGGRSAVIFRHPVDRALSLYRRSLERDRWDLFEQGRDLPRIHAELKQIFRQKRLVACHLLLRDLHHAHGRPYDLDVFADLLVHRRPTDVRALLTPENMTKLKQGRFVFHLMNGLEWDTRNLRDFPEREWLVFERTTKAGVFAPFADAALPADLAAALRATGALDSRPHEHDRSRELPKPAVLEEIEPDFPIIAPVLQRLREQHRNTHGEDIVDAYGRLGYRLDV